MSVSIVNMSETWRELKLAEIQAWVKVFAKSFKKGKNDIVCPSNIPLTITTVTRQLTFKVVDLNMQVQEDFNGVIHILLEFKCK